MLTGAITDLYKRFRLMNYRILFGRIRERDGSLSATEAYTVDVIFLLGDPTITKLAETLGISQPNATYKVNNLAAKGYVMRLPSSGDKRETRVCVSDRFYKYYGDLDHFADRAVEALQAGTAVELKKLMFTNVSVAKTTFVSDSTYTDYPYRAAVTLTGAIAGMVPEVIFSLEDAVSGSFAPVAQSYNGGVYIYADGQPSAAITIPTIILWRENS